MCKNDFNVLKNIVAAMTVAILLALPAGAQDDCGNASTDMPEAQSFESRGEGHFDPRAPPVAFIGGPGSVSLWQRQLDAGALRV